ncbi:MAG: hypothetical protein CMH26_04220 [Micavibrio sp.]|nr:hypothetical protein [Micavibrio sp.]|tara:strand:+ start:706 stop:897 length:192 start_codon:yes stop_codon:yes gene_type:complete
MTETAKALLFVCFLATSAVGLMGFSYTSHSGPIVLGTECRTAGHNGDHLYLGAIDCSDLFYKN